MTLSLTLIVLMAVMLAAGIYLMLERSLTRLLIGFLLVGNAVNLLIFLMSGPSGEAPIMSDGVPPEGMVDPLPQVLILTAIVINFGIGAFLLALIYRSWWLARLGASGDSVPDQHEDESEATVEETLRSTHEEDLAMQAALDASELDEPPQPEPQARSAHPLTGTIDLPRLGDPEESGGETE